jgi:penicillin-binding protein 1A
MSYRFPLIVLLSIFLSIGVGFGYIFIGKAVQYIGDATLASSPLPDLRDGPSQSTKIYDRHGALLYELGSQRRDVVSLGRVPKSVINAFLAAEDKTFYSNPGISLKSIFRALHADVKQDALLQGGSTITQQLAQKLVVSKKSNLSRKVREVIVSMVLTRQYSKDTILERYLNEVPVGGELVGIGTASQVYFGVPVDKLTLAQGACIAALINAPSTLDPYVNPDGLRARQKLVLSRMANFGFISPAKALAAQNEQVSFLPRQNTLKDPFFSFYVKDLLVQQFGEVAVEQEGLNVQTTLDPDLQKAAEQIVADRALKNAKDWNASNASLVAANPQNGQIVAFVGGADFEQSQVNILTSKRQPGSTIKPLFYYTAFSQGYSPDTLVADWREDFGGGYRPTDYGGGSSNSYYPMRTALAASLNIPAVRVLRGIGISNATDNLAKMGFPIIPGYHYTLPLALGAVGATPLEMAQSFSLLASDGKDIRLSPLLKVTDHRGQVLLDNTATEPGKQILDEQAVAAVTSIISDYPLKRSIYAGPMFANYSLSDRPAAAKTGTTSGPKDVWTIGYTPQLLTIVWSGNTNGSDLKPSADGLTVSAPIWHDFMSLALKDAPVLSFPEYHKIKLDDEHKYIDHKPQVATRVPTSGTPSASIIATPPPATP